MLEEGRILRETSLRLLFFAMALDIIIAILECITGLLTGSVALLGDAGNNFSHLVVFGLAWVGIYVAKHPPNASYTWGLQRAEVLASFCSALLLIGMSGGIFLGAAFRIFHPVEMIPGPLVVISFLDLTVDSGLAWLFARRSSSLAMRVTFWHLVGDAAASFAVLSAGAIIFFTGWDMIDPLAAGIIALIMCVPAIRLLKEAVRILLEGVPLGADSEVLKRAIEEFPGIARIQDIHIWALSSDRQSTCVNAHVFLKDAYIHDKEIGEELARMLKDHFDIQHITIQVHPPSFWPYSRYIRG